jgi:adenine/guanine phosphoribosyltransferase-like PRPP-binding protein
MRVVTEPEFQARMRECMASVDLTEVGSVTGPGRSGAVAAVYASHILGVPFVPYGSKAPALGRMLIVDTARESGRTLRKAARRYANDNPVVIVAFEEPPRVSFWYEARKPQHYRHERIAA